MRRAQRANAVHNYAFVLGVGLTIAVSSAEARTTGHRNTLSPIPKKPKIEQQSISFVVPPGQGSKMTEEGEGGGFVNTKTQSGSVKTRAIGNDDEFIYVKKGKEAEKGEAPKVNAKATLENEKDADGTAGGGGGAKGNRGEGNPEAMEASKVISSIGLFAGTRPRLGGMNQFSYVGPGASFTDGGGRPLTPAAMMALPPGTPINMLTKDGAVITGTTVTDQETKNEARIASNYKYRNVPFSAVEGGNGGTFNGVVGFRPDTATAMATVGIGQRELDYYNTSDATAARIAAEGTNTRISLWLLKSARTGYDMTIVGGK